MEFIKINAADNVAVAIRDIEAGLSFDINGVNVCTLNPVPAGHKVALQDLEEGADVIKYGFPIGHVLRPVKKGDVIDHTNLKTKTCTRRFWSAMSASIWRHTRALLTLFIPRITMPQAISRMSPSTIPRAISSNTSATPATIPSCLM